MDKNPTATPRTRQPFLPHGIALSDPEQAFKAMLTHIPKYQWLTFYGTMSGRWLLPAMVNLDGKFSAPWLIGVLSMLAIALAAWLTVKYRYGFFGGIVALTLSMGIYQSYFGVAAVLLVGALIFETLDNRSSFKTLLLRGVKFVITLAAGLLFYMLIVKFTTRNTELVSYMGISSMGSLSLSEFPQLIFSAYGRYFTFFLRRDNVFHFAFLRYAFVLVGIVYVMAPDAPAHLLMVYGLCFILIAPLALAEYYIAMPHDAKKRHFQKPL